MTWVIALRSSHWFRVSDTTGENISARLSGDLQSKPVVRIPDMDGNRSTVPLNTISGCYPEEVWDAMVHEKNGDWRCGASHWHKKGEGCGHAIVPPGARAHKAVPKPEQKTEAPRRQASPEQLAIVQRNLQALHRTGHMGTEGLSPEQLATVEAKRAFYEAKRAEYRPARISRRRGSLPDETEWRREEEKLVSQHGKTTLEERDAKDNQPPVEAYEGMEPTE